MKCSVCAQDVPEDRYSEHLESEHGVTDDPTAVLIQHLTGLHSTDADEEDGEALPDDEPSDADAFEEFLASHPIRPAEDHEGEPEAETAAPASAPVDEAQTTDEEESEEAEEPAAAATEETEEEVPPGEAPSLDGEELTDDDEAEFERMLSVYPDVDLRKGRPQPPAQEAEEAAPAETTVATAAKEGDTKDGDTKAPDDAATFAVWDQARGAAPEEADDDVLLVVPPAELEKARRRRQLAFLGLGAAFILVAIAVIYLLTRDTTKDNTASTAPVTITTPTTVAPTFLPGPQGGAPTTVDTTPPTTAAPAAPAVPATPATTAAPAPAAPPATAAPPPADPKSQISFPQMQGVCNSGQLTVNGTVTNNNPEAYSFSFTITFANSAGTVLGTANGTVQHEPAHSTGPFTASGSCTDVNSATSRTVQITQISPG